MTRSDMRNLVVDRIENGIAVLEGDGASMDVPASWLPTGAREGSVLRVEALQDEARHLEEMRHVRDRRLFSELTAVEVVGEGEGSVETRGKLRGGRSNH